MVAKVGVIRRRFATVDANGYNNGRVAKKETDLICVAASGSVVGFYGVCVKQYTFAGRWRRTAPIHGRRSLHHRLNFLVLRSPEYRALTDQTEKGSGSAHGDISTIGSSRSRSAANTACVVISPVPDDDRRSFSKQRGATFAFTWLFHRGGGLDLQNRSDYCAQPVTDGVAITGSKTFDYP